MSTSTRIGSTIAGYRLEALLGRGGMSVVYLAEHLRLGRKVALKLLAPALSQDADFRERFERESRRAAEMDHPNIIPVYDAGEAEGVLYIAMRYVRGSDLKSMLEGEGALGVGRTLYLLEQAAAALDAAHARDLVHRDVKPANILVEQPADNVFLSDFGIVKQTTASRGLTRTGIFVGTVDYAAPEQIEGQGVDKRTDVYALGCVLYECLTGRMPFAREGEVAVMHAHLTEAPPHVTAARADLPTGLNAVVARAMAKDREERFPSCGELMAAARSAALQRPTAAPTAHASDAALAAAGAPPRPRAAPPTAFADHQSVVPPAAVSQPGEPPPPPPQARAVAAGAALPGLGRNCRGARRRRDRGRRRLRRHARLGGIGPSSPPAAPQQPAAEPPAAEPPATEPPATEPPATEPPATTASGEEAVLADGLEPVTAPEIWQDCTVQPTPREGATETAVCVPPEGESRRFDSVELSLYPDAASLAAAYDSIRSEQDLDSDFGRCNATRWTGEGEWLHGEDRPGGRRMCYFDDDGVVIVWTHEKLGQPTHLDTLGMARLNGSNHAELFAWWSFWVHQIGLSQQ